MKSGEPKGPQLIPLLPWPNTAWTDSGRLGGKTPLGLTAEGRARALGWARELAGIDIGLVFVGDEQASLETAQIVIGQCSAKQKIVDDLAELDIGLWEGLTPEELSRRYPKVYKRWRDEPLSVCPPEGEDPESAKSRLSGAIERVMERQNGSGAVVIVGPLAYGMARTVIEGEATPQTGHRVSPVPVLYKIAEGEDTGSFRLISVVEISGDLALDKNKSEG